MGNSVISIDELRLNAHAIWGGQGLLLTSGDLAAGKFNCMTIGWGSIGVMWNRPFIQVVVRPTRYTDEFMQAYADFTVCAFPETYSKALQLLGTKSGRDGDKIAQAGLTPCAGTVAAAPAFAEANLVLECRKMYADVIRPESFIDPAIDRNYSLKDYHRVYFGEVLAISGDREVYC